MTVTHVVRMWPDEGDPQLGSFVRSHITALRDAGLQQRVVVDLGKAQATLTQMRQKKLQADIELHKMASLAEQDAKAVAHDAKRHEQKQMDELGVRQFILGMGY